MRSWVVFLGLVLLAPVTAGADRDPVAGHAVGDASPRSFDEFCSGELSPKRRKTYSAKLDSAEAALAKRDIEAAQAALLGALSAAYRGGAETPMSTKCIGRAAARRYFTLQLELYRQQSAAERAQDRIGIATLYATAVDEGADAVAQRAQQQKPKQVVASIRTLERLANQMETQLQFGAYLLGEEAALLTTLQRSIVILHARAALGHREALASEKAFFEKKITKEELAASDLLEGTQVLANAMAGVDVGLGTENEAMLLRARASESQRLLAEARIWNLETYEDLREAPESKRARMRGDMILERGRDGKQSLVYRDAALHASQRYYGFGGFEEEAAIVALEGESIAAVLQADDASRQSKLEEAKENLREEVGSLQQAVEGLKKSEAEKKTFEDEADALEAELGF